MSKINAIRLINLNYNNNAIRINDEMFCFHGESTLLSLRNGGGKSVLVQMMTAPFVHRRYRDAKDRPFESYFATNRPTFILVEWALDQGAGYVLTGMMVRKNQDLSEEQTEDLEIINFISEYREPCQCDIRHLPVVEQTKKELNLKGFAACRQLFETFRRDKSLRFYSYDMNVAAQSRQYFEKLKEYRIYYREWETIIKKVNLKESGLSDLFSDCRDEKGLVEKWFLDVVESKLNREKNRMKEFESIVTKYVNQYKDNRSKIERRNTIRLFREQAEGILSQAGDFRDAQEQVTGYENRIACFMAALERLAEQTAGEKEQIQAEMAADEEGLRHIAYEKISYGIHEKKKEQSYHLSSRDMAGLERGGLEQECARLLLSLHRQECARWRDEAEEGRRAYFLAGEKLAVFQKKQQDLAPERKMLGGRLRAGYERIFQELEQKKKDLEALKGETAASLETRKERQQKLQDDFQETGVAVGSLQARIASYDAEEALYNSRYQEGLCRNLLGEYEPAALELLKKAREEELEKKSQEQTERRKSLDRSQEELRSLERSAEDTGRKIARCEARQEGEEKHRQRLEEELRERKTILKYLELPQEAVFDRERILAAASKKLREVSLAKRGLEQELDEMEKESRRLKQGRVLELPKEFEELLDQMGISYVYGMDWLKRNGNTVGKNRELVKNQPFLPYALIIGGGGIGKLSASREPVYTSFPIPIIKREELERAGESDRGGIVAAAHLNFYVMFNDKLLDEETLRLLIQEKEERIAQKRGMIDQKSLEYGEYFEKQEKVKNQSLTAENYEQSEARLRELREESEELKRLLDGQRERAAAVNRAMRVLREEMAGAESWMEWARRRQEDLILLAGRYEQYLSDCRELGNIQKQREKLEDLLSQNRTQMENLSQQLQSLEHESYGLSARLEKAEENLRLFEKFRDEEVRAGEARVSEVRADKAQAYTDEEILKMRSRYDAITSRISGELRELEDSVTRAKRQYDKNQAEVSYLEAKYSFTASDYREIIYSRSEEERLEAVLGEKQREQEVLNLTWNEEDKKASLLGQKIEADVARMRKVCGEEEPLPREKIVLLDFEARENETAARLQAEKERLEASEKKLRGYEENWTALSEYQQFPVREAVEFQEDFAGMSYRELGNFKGMMIRDYRASLEERRKKRDILAAKLNRVVRMEEFQEEFFNKPLETLLQLTDDAPQVILQLGTTLSSYESLMEKLEVDISMIEKEKEKIIEILADYVREVHLNLGRIDKNSTVPIRGRQIRMLKILLPDWEENEALYQVRLQDYMEELTAKAVALLEQNENALEFLGTRVTTRNLYDAVVGIGNVGIRLFKIEEHREYPITWADVAKNSGGEGFLSAFVILNSLLYYMRMDDTDLFADRIEGKVLVMDNPFAQTNAAHLLKPLMDMAKKTDTQLICLTGLGGESIYSRFDNIYVLNLVAASLRAGMQYLKGEHIRGPQEEEMVLSRIEVARQLELEF